MLPHHLLWLSDHDMQWKRLWSTLAFDNLLLDETMFLVVGNVGCGAGLKVGGALFQIGLVTDLALGSLTTRFLGGRLGVFVLLTIVVICSISFLAYPLPRALGLVPR